MADKIDDLILQMQHLEASAKASAHARGGDRLKSKAQRLALSAKAELDAAEKGLAEGEAKMKKAVTPGLSPLDAAELITEGRRLVDQNKSAVVKARAKYNFALDAMAAGERAEFDTVQAELHLQMANDLDPGGPLSTDTSAPASSSTPKAPKGT
jgi:hypothetical protein